MKTYKVLALLLRYPEPDWLGDLSELRAVLHEERRSNRRAAERIDLLLSFLSGPLIDVQMHYVDIFDRQASHGLYLYEHMFGESRERGSAMVELLNQYRRYGLELECDELPDYLPVFLEFLSLLPPREARRCLRPAAGVVRLLASRLQQAQTPYAGVFDALVHLLPRGASSAMPEPPRPMDRLLEHRGPSPAGDEPLLIPGAFASPFDEHGG